MLIEAVEKRFGSVEAVPADHRLEFLSENGSVYIAAGTRSVARSLALKPIITPVCSPQSNGKAESFVNMFKRDYVARLDLSATQPPCWRSYQQRSSTSTRCIRTRR